MADRMPAPRGTAAERRREAREEAQRKARESVRLGGIGIAILFLCGVGTWLLPDYAYAFVGGMVLGILLILAAFLLVRGSILAFQEDGETKLY